MSLVVGPALIAAARGGTETFAATVYTATISGLFGVSALYHRGTWRPATRRLLQRADHVMILLLIAGSATPALLLAARGPVGLVGLGVLWTLTAGAAACRICWLTAPQRVVGALYLGLGSALHRRTQGSMGVGSRTARWRVVAVRPRTR